MKTIKQIADEIGVSKQRVYRYIRKNHISEAHHEAVIMWYDETAEKQITQYFRGQHHISEAHHDANQSTSLDTVIILLQKELDIKNEQIKDLNARLSETTTALLAAQQSAQAEQMLHAGTIQKQLTDGSGGGSPMDPDVRQANVFTRVWKAIKGE